MLRLVDAVDEGEIVGTAGPVVLTTVCATVFGAVRGRAVVFVSAGVVENSSGTTKTQSKNPMYSTKEVAATENNARLGWEAFIVAVNGGSIRTELPLVGTQFPLDKILLVME